jgi:SpoVK/Ycf46/Vps4 family AAA+-type ATPase
MSDDCSGAPAKPQQNRPAEQETNAANGKKAASTPPKAAEAPKEEIPPKEDIEDLKKELNELIGLTGIKREVNNLINIATVHNLRKKHGLKNPKLSLHMVFSGNPGTGKTTIARIMSRIYHSLDILSKGHLVEVDRSGLVAGYVGQTAIKTSEVIEKAKGGVLFIDEAYALTNRGSTDYGLEAVDTLLKAMEDMREDLVVIVAGYTELMKAFVHSNPGLESRFNRFMFFPDYTIDEMVGIFNMRCGKSGYALADGAEDTLRDILTEESKDVESFGNARGVRNLFERAIAAQADRLAKGEEEINKDTLMSLKSEDLRAALEDKKAEAGEKEIEEETGKE